MKEMLEAAKAAKGEVAGLTTEQKNAALNAMADALIAWQDAILGANALDMESAKAHISPVMLDRLKLTKERIAGMAQGIREVTALPDPVGRILQTHTREDGLEIQKVSVPMGVIAIILALFPMDVVAWINLFAFGGLESAFVWPVLLGLFSRRFNTCGLLVSIASSISVYAIGMIFKISMFSAHAIVPALIAGLIGAIIGTWIGNNMLRQGMSRQTHDIFFPHKPYLSRA